MRWKIAEMYKDIEVGRSMLYRACASADPFPDPLLAAVAKTYCNEMALRVTSEAFSHGRHRFTANSRSRASTATPGKAPWAGARPKPCVT